MKRLDEGKVSLVEFLRSIKYAGHTKSNCRSEYPRHFADANPQTRAERKLNLEESSLVRSVN